MKTLSLLVAAALVPFAALTACGGTVEGTGGQTTTTTTTETGLGGGACDPWTDADGIASLTVTFHNETPNPIYLPGTCSGPQYSITPAGGFPSSQYTYDASCLQTCADLMHEPRYECGACPPQSYRIEPGGTLTRTWDGTGLTAPRDMLDACWFGGQAMGQCASRTAAPAGDYNVGATAFASCGDGCTCTDDGVCDGDATGSQATSDPVAISFPTVTSVDVVFGGCAFGCPQGGD